MKAANAFMDPRARAVEDDQGLVDDFASRSEEGEGEGEGEPTGRRSVRLSRLPKSDDRDLEVLSPQSTSTANHVIKRKRNEKSDNNEKESSQKKAKVDSPKPGSPFSHFQNVLSF
jgi:hypothetical protein